MLTEQASAIINRLISAREAGAIYNVDYTEAKDRLGRAFEKDLDTLKNVLLNSGDGSGYSRTSNATYPGISELYDLCPYGLYNLPTLAKGFKKLGALPEAISIQALQIIADWSPVHTLIFTELKPLIIKGRKPSDDPNKTPARTLEGTGTCPVCGRNVKIDERFRIVNHGYEVQYHSFQGGCYGVGYRAWEVSTEGAVAFQAAIIKQKARAEELLPSIDGWTSIWSHSRKAHVPAGDPIFARLIAAKKQEVEREISYCGSLIADLTKKIEGWKPQPLPGILAGFSR